MAQQSIQIYESIQPLFNLILVLNLGYLQMSFIWFRKWRVLTAISHAGWAETKDDDWFILMLNESIDAMRVYTES